MTWSMNFRNLNELSSAKGGLDPAQQPQFELARRLAIAIILDGGLGDVKDNYSIALSGHAAGDSHGNVGVSVSHRSEANAG